MKIKGTHTFIAKRSNVPVPARIKVCVPFVFLKVCVPFIFFAAASVFAAPAQQSQDVFASPATAERFAHDLGEAAQALKGARTLRGAYVQDKSLAGLPHPLHAEGSFLFVRDLGIAWRTTTPFESELVITGTDILQRENGRVSMHLSAAQQPAVRIVSEIFSAVFALDFNALSAHFDLYSRKAGRGWELGLKPHEANGALKQIVVSGGKQVERVRVLDVNGDTTDIHLRATAVSQAAPAADELKRFRP